MSNRAHHVPLPPCSATGHSSFPLSARSGRCCDPRTEVCWQKTTRKLTLAGDEEDECFSSDHAFWKGVVTSALWTTCSMASNARVAELHANPHIISTLNIED